MLRPVFALLLAAPLVAAPPTGFQEVTLGKHTFTLPKGFTIELAAEVDHPVVANFDAKGRLFVAESSGSNAKPADQLNDPTNRVLMLEADKDGKFTKRTVFADKLPFLQGCLPHGGSVYVATPPTITKLTDTDADGVADKRETWFDGGTLTGCANDVHGPYLGPDERLYFSKGGFAKQELTLGTGKKFSTRAAHVYSAKKDGSDLRVEMTGGMDNPVDVEFSASGDLFFTTTFLQHPANGRRDGIIHATYGAVYGKDHDVLADHPRSRPELSEPMTHLGPAAPSGLVRYNGSQFGGEYRGNLFCAQFNTAKVSRHVLKPKGATYETTDSDFVTSDNRDFHPTDVIQDGDGGLLVIDTGGWYKLCCPSSVTEKKDLVGAIYLVRKSDGEKHVAGPRYAGDAKGWNTAVQELAHYGRQADRKVVPYILRALADETIDRVLDAAYTRALFDIGDADATRKGLSAKSPRAVRAAVMALEQMPDGKLVPDEVVPLLTSPDSDLRDTAWWVMARHPFWAEHAKAAVCELLGQSDPTPAEFEQSARRVALVMGTPNIREFLTTGPADRLKLRAVAVAKWSDVHPDWHKLLAEGLRQKEEATVRAALAAVRALPKSDAPSEVLSKALAGLAADAKRPADVRLAAAALHPKGFTADLFGVAVAGLHRDQPAAGRAAAADAIGRADLSAKQFVAVAEAIPAASPLDLDKLLAVFGKTTDEAVGLAVVKALLEPKVRAAIRAEQVKPILAKYPNTVQAEADKLYKQLDADRGEWMKKLDALLSDAKPGDVRRGQAVFNTAKASCVACHKVGYVGGSIGPDLTKIGGIRSERDLLEAVVFPSASFVRSYEPVKVELKDGRSVGGILKADAPDEIVVTVNATEEVRISRKEVDEVKPGTVSVMPAGLDQQLSKQELADLVAFLRSLK